MIHIISRATSTAAVTTHQLHQRVQFLTRKLQETIESRDYYANLYYSTKQKLESTRSSLHYVMQHLKFIGNQGNWMNIQTYTLIY